MLTHYQTQQCEEQRIFPACSIKTVIVPLQRARMGETLSVDAAPCVKSTMEKDEEMWSSEGMQSG